MSRPRGNAKDVHDYTVDATGFSKIHSVSGLYLADVSHRSDERLVIGERGVSASNDVEEDPLPPLSKLGTADAEELEVLGNHLSRHHGFASARVRRGPSGTFVLATVITQRRP